MWSHWPATSLKAFVRLRTRRKFWKIFSQKISCVWIASSGFRSDKSLPFVVASQNRGKSEVDRRLTDEGEIMDGEIAACFYSHFCSPSSVTMWRNYFPNIWPFIKMKIWPQKFPKQVQNSAKYKIKITKYLKNLAKVTKFRQVWSHWPHTVETIYSVNYAALVLSILICQKMLNKQ